MGGSKHNKRQSQITMRLAMLVAGVCLYGGYSYFTSQSTDNGITSINELNPNYADSYNNQEVSLNLDEKYLNTSHIQTYKSMKFIIKRTFTNDFDF